MNKKLFNAFISKLTCSSCGAPLRQANLTLLLETSVASIFSAVCSECSRRSIIVTTISGVGVSAIATDLTDQELLDFLGREPISGDELLDLHQLLKNDSIWNLLPTSETSWENKSKNFAPKGKSPPLSTVKM